MFIEHIIWAMTETLLNMNLCLLASFKKTKTLFDNLLNTSARCVLLVAQNFAFWNPVIKLFAQFRVFALLWEENA